MKAKWAPVITSYFLALAGLYGCGGGGSTDAGGTPDVTAPVDSTEVTEVPAPDAVDTTDNDTSPDAELMDATETTAEHCTVEFYFVDFPCGMPGMPKPINCTSPTEYIKHESVPCGDYYPFEPECCQGAGCEYVGDFQCGSGQLCINDPGDGPEGCMDLPACDTDDDCAVETGWPSCLVHLYCFEGQCRFIEDDCDDGVPCTEDWCDLDPVSGGCRHAPKDCDDGKFCTLDMCDPITGDCIHALVNCSDGEICTIDTCNLDTDTCEHEWAAGCKCESNEDCDNSNPCIVGLCEPDSMCKYTMKWCDDETPCTIDSCWPEHPKYWAGEQDDACAHFLWWACQFTCTEDEECEDGNACTLDACQCWAPDNCLCETVGEVNCDDGDPCTEDICIPVDDDGDPCQHESIPVCQPEGT